TRMLLPDLIRSRRSSRTLSNSSPADDRRYRSTWPHYSEISCNGGSNRSEDGSCYHDTPLLLEGAECEPGRSFWMDDPKTNPTDNTQKDPDEWVSGGAGGRADGRWRSMALRRS